jgi:hypothetical protein
MKTVARISYASIVTALVSTIPLGAMAEPDWQQVAEADSKTVFVNLNSLKRNGNIVQATVKENYVEPQPSAKKDKTFLSARNVYRFDCSAARVAYKEMHAFPLADLQGKEIQKAEYRDKNLVWMDAPSGTVFEALLRYSCDKAPADSGAPASD